MYITRDLEKSVAEAIRGRKVVILYGSKQTGKTTLVEHLLSAEDIREGGVVTLSGDVRDERELLAYEFKWNPTKAAKAKCPKAFAEAYPDARWQCISQENYVEFVTGRI